MTNPAWLTIAEASESIRRRDLSPVELTEACIRRIETLDPQISAVVTLTGERAMEDACRAESELANGRWRGPMHGIPFGLKDIYDTAGIRTAGQSRIAMDNVPAQNAAAVDRLSAAGAILLGKLTTHEFARSGPAFDLPWPPARNPWDPTRVPGGSSSGSAAAVAAGFLPAALGTDTGGSIRSPAALCGVVGLKPSYGRVSRRGVMPNAFSLDHCGPMTWCVEDCAIVLGAIAGADHLDPTSAQRPVPDYRAALFDGIKGLRVGAIRHFWTDERPASPAICDAMEDAIEILRGLGAVVEEARLRPIAHYNAVKIALGETEVYAVHQPNLVARLDEFGIDFQKRIVAACLIGTPAYVQAQRERRRMIAGMKAVFERCDVLLTATVARTAAAFGRPSRPPAWTEPGMTAPFNVLGLPALSLCNGFDADGLPLGMQIVGRPFDEATVLRVAHAYEAATPWRSRRPALVEGTPPAPVGPPPEQPAGSGTDRSTRNFVDTMLARAGLSPSDAVRGAACAAAPALLQAMGSLPRDHAFSDEPAAVFGFATASGKPRP
ncbi:MAG: amidase [Defluviicoccus sp.]|nr:amidase [Defluviicoccus sp.]